MTGKLVSNPLFKISIFIIALVFSLTQLNGCGKDTKQKKSVETKPISIKKFDTPAGADPSVTAEMGGAGFTGEGWKTAADYNTYGDPKATKGGDITWSIPDFPASLRAYGKDENSYYTRMAQNMMYERLLQQDPVTEEFNPWLATHWKISDDKMTYTFRLNPDARWADGKPVIADDYIATWKLIIDPTILSGGNEYYTDNFEMPKAESKYIITVKAKKLGWAYFEAAASIKLLPAHYLTGLTGKDYLDKYNYDCVPGSGPYYIMKDDVDKGRSITMRRRSDYWGENERWAKGLNNFDIFKTIVVQDETLEFEKFKKGETDIYSVNRAAWWAEKTDFDDVKNGLVVKKKIYNQKPAGTSGIALNMRKPPFDDQRVREAFAKLYDRSKFNEKLFYNSYTPLKSFFSSTPYQNQNNKLVEFDLDGAIKLLEEAGYTQKNSDGYRMKDGRVLELELPFPQAPMERYLTIYQEDLKKAGIKLNLKQVDGTTNFQIGNQRNFTMIMFAWGGQNPPSLEFTVTSNTADDANSTNWAGYKSKRVDEIAKQYNLTFERKDRYKQVQEIDSILFNMHPEVFGWYADYQRLLWHNKFGMPKWILSRGDDYYGGTDTPIFQMWWADAEKMAAYDDAKSGGKKIDNGPVEEKFWVDLSKRVNGGEAVKLTP
ncbi:extracellular solute-binding protein [soil metagenome]